MDNQDKLFNQIKSAAENAETKDFSSMEKIWSRIDAKLDTKVEKKQNNNWKKLLVAASILVVVSIGYHYLNNNTKVEIPQNNVVKSDTKELESKKIQRDTNGIVFTNPLIKKDADKILKKQISSQNQVTLNYSTDVVANEIATDSIATLDKGYYDTGSKKASSNWSGNKKFESRGVIQEEAASEKIAYSISLKDKQENTKKLAPLMVIDGAVSKKDLSNLDDEEVESIVELKEPLYIINSIYYTEKELFGPNPTSPYAPLNVQKIETISILQPEKAVTIYGEKGKKGIVIITTKDGKPLPKK